MQVKITNIKWAGRSADWCPPGAVVCKEGDLSITGDKADTMKVLIALGI